MDDAKARWIIDRVLLQNSWLKVRLAELQLPEHRRETVAQIEQWLAECGMPPLSAGQGLPHSENDPETAT